MGAPPRVSVHPLAAGEMIDVSVEMTSPACTGLYSSKWRMTTANGSFYGGEVTTSFWSLANTAISQISS